MTIEHCRLVKPCMRNINLNNCSLHVNGNSGQTGRKSRLIELRELNALGNKYSTAFQLFILYLNR